MIIDKIHFKAYKDYKACFTNHDNMLLNLCYILDGMRLMYR